MDKVVLGEDLKTECSIESDANVPLASIRGLGVKFPRPNGETLTIIENVNFEICSGEIVGLVGESGSGKSVTARALLGILPNSAEVSGEIVVDGLSLHNMRSESLRKLQGSLISMIFQDPMTSFNPVRTIGDQIGEAIRVHGGSKKTVHNEVVRLLEAVGIPHPEKRSRQYPGSFSGGMLQRAMIAMAVANSPKLLLADEPTTALDATVQDSILELLRERNREQGMGMLLITHNIAVVASICTRVIVMYSGRIVEEGPVKDVLRRPQHPYTSMLLKSVPRLDKPHERLVSIEGIPPDLLNPPSGCRFSSRCPYVTEHCTIEEPELKAGARDGKFRCFFDLETLAGNDGQNA